MEKLGQNMINQSPPHCVRSSRWGGSQWERGRSGDGVRRGRALRPGRRVAWGDDGCDEEAIDGGDDDSDGDDDDDGDDDSCLKSTSASSMALASIMDCW